MRIRIALLCLVYVVLALVGDALLSVWAHQRRQVLLVACLTHAAASCAWALAMRQGASFGRSAVALILANLVGAVLMGRYVFGEPLTSTHVAGIALSIVAVCFLA